MQCYFGTIYTLFNIVHDDELFKAMCHHNMKHNNENPDSEITMNMAREAFESSVVPIVHDIHNEISQYSKPYTCFRGMTFANTKVIDLFLENLNNEKEKYILCSQNIFTALRYTENFTKQSATLQANKYTTQKKRIGLLIIYDSVEAVDISDLNKVAPNEQELWLTNCDLHIAHCSENLMF